MVVLIWKVIATIYSYSRFTGYSKQGIRVNSANTKDMGIPAALCLQLCSHHSNPVRLCAILQKGTSQRI